MSSHSSPTEKRTGLGRVTLVVLLLMLIALACRLPGFGPSPAEQTAAAPGVSVGPLPPSVIEVWPPPGSELPLSGAITFSFNQAMDRPSVEAGLFGQPALSGSFEWLDDSTVTFSPLSPWLPETAVTITVGETAQASNGLSMPGALSFDFVAASYLRLSQSLPTENTVDVDPTSAIVAAFNQPVVPLGADPASQAAGFSIEPAAQGRGEWLNTSTFIFYPEPGLEGGVVYTIRLDPNLRSTNGAPLEETAEWSFVTSKPGVESVRPASGTQHVRLDAEITLSFNQPMDTASIESNFALRKPDGTSVPGKIDWTDDFDSFTFTPDGLLERATRYLISLPAGTTGQGGTPLEAGLESGFTSTGEFAVIETSPLQNGEKQYYNSVIFTFNSPVAGDEIADYIKVDPPTPIQVDWEENRVWLSGAFAAEDQYIITVTSGLRDIWNDPLGVDYVLKFRSAPLPPQFTSPSFFGGGVLFVDPRDPRISVQAANISSVDLLLGSAPIPDFFVMNNYETAYNIRSEYRPSLVESYSVSLGLAPDRIQVSSILLAEEGRLTPGLYWYAMQPAELEASSVGAEPSFAVASHVHLVYKLGAIDALVWAVDNRTGSPVDGQPVSLFDSQGKLLAAGQTDSDGVFISAIPPREDAWEISYAVMGSPGDEFFSLASSGWDTGISPWQFGYTERVQPPRTTAYFYTDRPVYRPGDPVHFRAVIRQTFNGRYQDPGISDTQITVFDPSGAEIASFTLPLSEFATAQGSYTLSDAAGVGTYWLASEDDQSRVAFKVSEYRKPEIDLAVSVDQAEVQSSDTAAGEISARYFFDAPADGVAFSWNLYARDGFFSLPGYRVGPNDGFFSASISGTLGRWEDGGAGKTLSDGTYPLSLSFENSDRLKIYTLEALVEDESGFPVANREVFTVHPAPFYIGVRSESWLGRAETEMGFDLLLVDWNQNPAGSRSLTASFNQVDWVRVGSTQFGAPEYERRLTEVSSGSFSSDDQGQARLAFTPPSPGLYMLEVQGGGALTQAMVWVGGPGQALWPNLRQHQINLVADSETYQEDSVAQVFIPNPFSGPARVLVTMERGEVISHRMIIIDGTGMTLPVELGADAVPNVYLSAALYGIEDNGDPGFRLGIVNLEVTPRQQELIVAVVGDPQRTAPGQPVNFTIKVTDSDGNPVEGEFSLSIVDQAVLALQDAYEQDILSAFYGPQPLGVSSSASFIAAADRFEDFPQGVGGGGGGGDPQQAELRSDFQDTAYWNAQIVTDQDGLAQVEAQLPDNLTTWRVLVRGLTKDTRVGEAVSEVVSTKPLLVRPVTPRFFVVGDHAVIAAVVHNNSDQNLTVSVALQTKGFALDDVATALREIEITAGGRTRLEWWGTVEDAPSVDLTFAAEGGGLSDLVKPEGGALPVLRYTAQQTFAASGLLDTGGERLEVVSLPHSFDPTGGSLTLELSSSLAGAMLEGLAVLENSPYEGSEQTVSRFLPNLETYLALRDFGLDAPAFEARLERTLEISVAEIEGAQNYDGGWGWFLVFGEKSNPYLTAYTLLGLLRAQEAGIELEPNSVADAVNYLHTYLLNSENGLDEPWEYDRAAFMHYVLGIAEFSLIDQAFLLYDHRAQMNPWSRAFLALAIEQSSPGSEQAAALFSDLEAGAVRSASGAHWEESAESWRNMGSAAFNDAVVVFALVQQDPASPLVADAVRYMMANRGQDGSWGASYSSAWTIMALTKVIKGTGELGGEFEFSATLNGVPLASGQAGGAEQFTPVVAEIGLNGLTSNKPNALTVQRDPGSGRLYYRALLAVSQPVESVTPINRGISVARVYYPPESECTNQECEPLSGAHSGDLVTVRLTLTLPHDIHYLAVEDMIPAGTEVLDTSLKTTQQGFGPQQEPSFNIRNPFQDGWGWWLFGRPQIYDERVVWMAEFVPAGTYELTYTLVVLQPGQYQVIPARAWQFYFPEVQGASAGAVFEVRP